MRFSWIAAWILILTTILCNVLERLHCTTSLGKAFEKPFVLLHCTQFLSLLCGPYLTAYSHTWKDVLSTSQTEYCLKQRPLFKKSKLRRTRLKAVGDWLKFRKARDYGSSRSRFPSRAWRYSKAHSSGLMEQEISRCKSVVNRVGKKC